MDAPANKIPVALADYGDMSLTDASVFVNAKHKNTYLSQASVTHASLKFISMMKNT